jgi:hypothetical protein
MNRAERRRHTTAKAVEHFLPSVALDLSPHTQADLT